MVDLLTRRTTTDFRGAGSRNGIGHSRSSRTGVYQYTGREVDPNNEHGLRDQAVVNVLRDGETVFDKKAAHSFIGKPITDNHPSVAGRRDQLARPCARRRHGRAQGRRASRVRHPADRCDRDCGVDGGKRELSNGYAADLEFGDFTADDGTACQVRQASIRGNHVAIVDKGRAGRPAPDCDAARCVSLPADVFELLTDERTYSDGPNANTNEPTNVVRQSGEFQMPHTLMIDNLQVPNVSDEAKAAIEKLQGQLKDEKARADKAEGQVATLTTDKGKLEGEKLGLEKQLKDATDPATLQAAATARAALINKAISVSPNIVTDGKSDAEIRKEVVSAKLGDDGQGLRRRQDRRRFPVADKGRAWRRSGSRRAQVRRPHQHNDSGASVRDLARAAQF
jgi:hypothetical protein